MKKWIADVMKAPFPADMTFAEALRTGELLCHLVNAIGLPNIDKDPHFLMSLSSPWDDP